MKTIEELEAEWKQAMAATSDARKAHEAVQAALLPLQLESNRRFDELMAAIGVQDAAFDALFDARKAASADPVGDA